MKLNVKKILGGVGAVILSAGGLILAGKSEFCKGLGVKPDEKETPETDDNGGAETEETETEDEKPLEIVEADGEED